MTYTEKQLERARSAWDRATCADMLGDSDPVEIIATALAEERAEERKRCADAGFRSAQYACNTPDDVHAAILSEAGEDK